MKKDILLSERAVTESACRASGRAAERHGTSMKQEDTKQGNQQKQEYEQYVKSVTPTHNLWAQMGKAVSDRWDHLLYRAGNPELYRQCAGNGSPDGRQLVFPDPGVCIGGTHGTAYLSQDRQMGRCRSLSTHHRLCQFRDSPGGGIPERRPGIRYRLQDIHHCRTCDPVWNFRQLGIGTDLLGAADVRDPIVS